MMRREPAQDDKCKDDRSPTRSRVPFAESISMLLVLDVGNTNTVLGVFESPIGFESTGKAPRLVAHWRVATIQTQTVDEYGVLFRKLFAMERVQVEEIRGIVISSVVPPMD